MLVAQSCSTLCNPVECSPPDSSVHGMDKNTGGMDKNTGGSCHFHLQGIFLTQGWNQGLPHCGQILHLLSHQGSPSMLKAPGFYFIVFELEQEEIGLPLWLS